MIFTRSGLLTMGAVVGAGIVGLLDDWIKVSRERNLGLSKRAKMGGLLVVAVGFAVLAAFHTPVHFTSCRSPGSTTASRSAGGRGSS